MASHRRKTAAQIKEQAIRLRVKTHGDKKQLDGRSKRARQLMKRYYKLFDIEERYMTNLSKIGATNPDGEIIGRKDINKNTPYENEGGSTHSRREYMYGLSVG